MQAFLTTLAGLLMAGWCFAASADEYPSRRITLIVPYPPAGGVDSADEYAADMRRQGAKWAAVLAVRLAQAPLSNPEHPARDHRRRRCAMTSSALA
jgi:tripartite-type tricarboxylate transporter receptor subunit TctC